MSKEYKKNYISNFIIRLDLENKLNEGEYDKLISLLTKDFPINERRDIQNRNIIIKDHDKNNPEAMLSDPELKIQNILYNSSKTERITINSDSILYESLKYTSFTYVKPFLKNIVKCLTKEYNIKNFNRIGLRYVNLIKMPIKNKKEIFDWTGYINNALIFDSNFIEDKNMLQEIRIIDFKLDENYDLLCRLQVGIPNRNMPADLMEKIYLIDIDGYSNSLVEQDDAIDVLTKIHDKNIEIFEKCIEDNLRSDMDE